MSKIIFFGNQKLIQGIKPDVTTVTDALKRAGHEVIATITTREELTSIPTLIEQHPDAIGILASFGYIVPEKIFSLFEPLGILNIHPSLLPQYRGSTPIETAILNGDSQTGVSIMKIVRAMDAGPVYAQQTATIDPSDTKFTLADKLTRLGADMLLEVIKGQPTPVDQVGEPTFTDKLDKSQSPLEPSKPATQLEREVRAFLGFPRSRATLRGIDCIITAAHVADTPNYDFDLKCSDGKYLCIDRLIPANSREQSAQAFSIGH